jgi:hypothetical protein
MITEEYKGYTYEIWCASLKIKGIGEFNPMFGNKILDLSIKEQEKKLKAKARYRINKHLSKIQKRKNE